MRDLAGIAVFALAVAAAAFASDSGVLLNGLMMTLYAALLAQAWNVLGGYGGQFSFGHALFFGTGAYVQVIAQVSGGLNAWVALPIAVAASASVGAAVGALTFRYGLKGSYFALVTLAFAEVFRILAVSVDFTGGGVGMMLPLRESAANLQFGSRRGFVLLALGFVVVALLLTAWLRSSRFGARLQAVRDNEDAARAVGVDPFGIKLGAIVLSGALMGAGVRSTSRCSSTSTRASPSGRPPRSRRWSRRSSAAWARCGDRCSARRSCTRSPRRRATCSASCRGSTWWSTASCWC